MRTRSTLLLGVLLFACVAGQGYVFTKTIDRRAQIIRDPVVPVSQKNWNHEAASRGETNACTSDWLLSHWGKPAKIHTADTQGGDEYWTYHFGLAWNSITPVFIVPVPVGVPLHHKKVQFQIHDGYVVAASQKNFRSTEHIYGLIPGICGFYFGSYSSNE